MALKFVISCLMLGFSSTSAFSGAFDTDLYERVIDAQLCQEQLTILSNDPLRFTCKYSALELYDNNV